MYVAFLVLTFSKSDYLVPFVLLIGGLKPIQVQEIVFYILDVVLWSILVKCFSECLSFFYIMMNQIFKSKLILDCSLLTFSSTHGVKEKFSWRQTSVEAILDKTFSCWDFS